MTNSEHITQPDVSQRSDIEFCYITDSSTLEHELEKRCHAEVYGLDTETIGLDPHTACLRLVQIAVVNAPVLVIDMVAISQHEWQPLKSFLQNNAIKVAHNWKFDFQMLTMHGLEPTMPMFDTMLASQLIRAGLPGSHSLQQVASRNLSLGESLAKEFQKSDWSGNLTEQQLAYAAKDAFILLKLRDVLKKKIVQAQLQEAARIEFGAIRAIASMELAGMKLDLNKWQTLTAHMEDLRSRLRKKLETIEKNSPQLTLFGRDPIDPDSPTQLLAGLRSLGIKVNSTSKNQLAPIAREYPVVKDILAYRKTAKILDGFGYPIPRLISPTTGRLHTTLHQIGAASGRSSSSKPNLQQIPNRAEVRACFVAVEGHKLVIADFSQIELRIIAEISKDRRMREAYQNGEDLHCLTASLILNKPLKAISKDDRKIAKPANFGLAYGMRTGGFQQYAAVNYELYLTFEEADRFRNNFFSAYSGLADWHEREARALAKGKYVARTLAGRRRIWTRESPPSFNELINTPVQGTSADITKLALHYFYPTLALLKAKPLNVIHDEIVLEVPTSHAEDAKDTLTRAMVRAGERFLREVPVVVDATIADNWAGKC